MNNSLVTTGLSALSAGSVERFFGSATLNGLPWSTVGGTVVLKLINSSGVVTSITATISGLEFYGDWTAVAGQWLRVWDITDSTGRRQVSAPIPFTVVDPLIP